MEEVTDINKTLADAREVLETSKRLLEEIEEMKRYEASLLERYKTQKSWFRNEPGRVTTEDIIKACFEFGWACHNNFIHKNT